MSFRIVHMESTPTKVHLTKRTKELSTSSSSSYLTSLAATSPFSPLETPLASLSLSHFNSSHKTLPPSVTLVDKLFRRRHPPLLAESEVSPLRLSFITDSSKEGPEGEGMDWELSHNEVSFLNPGPQRFRQYGARSGLENIFEEGLRLNDTPSRIGDEDKMEKKTISAWRPWWLQ